MGWVVVETRHLVETKPNSNKGPGRASLFWVLNNWQFWMHFPQEPIAMTTNKRTTFSINSATLGIKQTLKYSQEKAHFIHSVHICDRQWAWISVENQSTIAIFSAQMNVHSHGNDGQANRMPISQWYSEKRKKSNLLSNSKNIYTNKIFVRKEKW